MKRFLFSSGSSILQQLIVLSYFIYVICNGYLYSRLNSIKYMIFYRTLLLAFLLSLFSQNSELNLSDNLLELFLNLNYLYHTHIHVDFLVHKVEKVRKIQNLIL